MPTQNLPNYLFLGEEDFLKEEAVKRLKSQFLDSSTHELNYSVFYAKDKNCNIRGLLDNLRTMPFLAKKRIVILKDANSLHKSDKEAILIYLHNPRETSLFVIEDRTPVIKGGFLLDISKLVQLVYYRKLTDSGVNAWLGKKAALSGKRITLEAISLIKENSSNDLSSLSSSMDSIILYVGKRPSITKQDVEKVIGISSSHTAFDLIGSIGKRDIKKALRVFSALKKDRKKETELLGLMAWNARMILRVKELLAIKNNIEMRRDFGLSPKMFEQIARHASGFTRKKIFTILDDLLKADLDIKTGMVPAIVMENLIVKMCLNANYR